MDPPSSEISRALFQNNLFHKNFARFLSEPEHKQSEHNLHSNNSKSCLLEDNAVVTRLKPDKSCNANSASSVSTFNQTSVNPAAEATLTSWEFYEQPITSARFAPAEALIGDVPVIEENVAEPQANNNGPAVLGIDNNGQAAMAGGGNLAAPGDGDHAPVPLVAPHPAEPVDGEQAVVPGDGVQAALPEDDEQIEDLILKEQTRRHPSHATPPWSGMEPLNEKHN